MANKVTTLIDADNNDQLYPRTKASAVSDSAGNSIENSLMYHDSGTASSGTTPINADQLGGYSASDFVRTDAVDEVAYYTADTIASGVKTVDIGLLKTTGFQKLPNSVDVSVTKTGVLLAKLDYPVGGTTEYRNLSINGNTYPIYGGQVYTFNIKEGDVIQGAGTSVMWYCILYIE